MNFIGCLVHRTILTSHLFPFPGLWLPVVLGGILLPCLPCLLLCFFLETFGTQCCSVLIVLLTPCCFSPQYRHSQFTGKNRA